MNRIKALLICVSATFSIIPGLATIREGLFAPPRYELLFSGFATAFGMLTFICVATCRAKLQSTSRIRLIVTAGAAMALALLFLIVYIYIRETTVVPTEIQSGPGREVTEVTHYLPLFPRQGGHLDRQLRKPAIRGNRAKLVQHHNPDIERWTGDEDMWLTTILFLLTHVGMITCITAAFGVIGFGFRDEGESIESDG